MSPIESSSSFTLIPINEKSKNLSDINSNIEKIPLKSFEKQIKFEVKTDTFNRNIQVKTKQEDSICKTNKFHPTAICSTTNLSTSPKTIRIQRSPNSTGQFFKNNIFLN